MTGLEVQHPPGARMGHPDIRDPQDTSHQGTRSQVAPHRAGHALSLHPLMSPIPLGSKPPYASQRRLPPGPWG